MRNQGRVEGGTDTVTATRAETVGTEPGTDTFVRARGVQDPPEGEALWFVMQGAKVLLRQEGPDDKPVIPTASSPEDLGLTVSRRLYIGLFDGVPCIVARLDGDAVPDAYAVHDLRSLYGLVPESAWSVAGLATQLLYWAETTRYCPRTGDETRAKPGEWATECPSCGLTQYPRVSPCIIVLIHDDDRLLLTRQSSWPPNRYSLVAGFVEPGETLEECVAREIAEETGVRVHAPHYVGSQPWPFPHQLMVGFTARYAGGDIVVDHSELEDARWFPLTELPLRPPPMSIAGRIIEGYLNSY